MEELSTSNLNSSFSINKDECTNDDGSSYDEDYHCYFLGRVKGMIARGVRKREGSGKGGREGENKVDEKGGRKIESGNGYPALYFVFAFTACNINIAIGLLRVNQQLKEYINKLGTNKIGKKKMR